jgi:hypothetical protein
LLVTSVVALGAGCGGPDTNGLADASAAQVGTRSLDALRTAGAVRVVGSLSSANQDGASTWDLLMAGSSTKGTFTQDGHRIEVVKIGDDTYIQGDRAYYEDINEKGAADLLADHWVRLSPTQANQYRFLTIDGLALSLSDYVTGLDGSVRRVDLAGHKAVVVAGKAGTTLYASETGSPVPLRIDLTGSDNGRIAFSDYGASLSVDRPANAVDLSSIG